MTADVTRLADAERERSQRTLHGPGARRGGRHRGGAARPQIERSDWLAAVMMDVARGAGGLAQTRATIAGRFEQTGAVGRCCRWP